MGAGLGARGVGAGLEARGLGDEREMDEAGREIREREDGVARGVGLAVDRLERERELLRLGRADALGDTLDVVGRAVRVRLG